jgi:hypothetical protein
MVKLALWSITFTFLTTRTGHPVLITFQRLSGAPNEDLADHLPKGDCMVGNAVALTG